MARIQQKLWKTISNATYNPRLKIWNKVKKSSKIGQDFGIYFCILFDCYCHNLIFGRETGYYAMFPPTFNIFLIFANFLRCLKLVFTILYQIVIFSLQDSPSETIKNVFYFIEKVIFVLEIFKFLQFSPFLSTLSRFKRTNGSEVIYDVMNWLA